MHRARPAPAVLSNRPSETGRLVGCCLSGSATGGIVGIAAASSTRSYWLVRDNGTVEDWGGAPMLGDLRGVRLNAPIVSIVPTATGRGYWLVSADGGVFAFGDAPFLGSAAGLHLAAPVVGMTVTPTGRGYWLTAADGGVFNYGDAVYLGPTDTG